MKSLTQIPSRRLGAGDLTEKIAFQSETAAPDGGGGSTATWALAFEDYAAVEPLFAVEREQQGAIRNTSEYMFWIYERGDVTEQMRIVWNGRRYNIRGFRREAAHKLFLGIVAEDGDGA